MKSQEPKEEDKLHVCPQDSEGLCDDCPCHDEKEPKDRSCCERCLGVYTKQCVKPDCSRCHTKEAAEWENKLKEIIFCCGNEYCERDCLEITMKDLTTFIHKLLKETQDKTRREILAALPPRVTAMLTDRSDFFRGWNEALSAARDTITNQNKS